ncbi:MAG: DMT family transporter [Deltaproteobacteria bacterium]|nr:DMT family transporter [Deltaproteobacteria bacterium]
MRSLSPVARSARWLPLALGVAVIAISAAAVLFRLAPHVPPLTAAGDRLLLAGLVLLPFVWRRLGTLRPGLVLGAGLAYAIHFGAWVASLHYTSIAASVTAVTTSPLLLAALGLATGRDPPTRRLLAALALGLAGVLVLALASPADVPGADPGLGLALAVLGAGAIAAYFLLARRAAPTADPFAFSAVATLVGGALLLGAALVVGDPLVPATLEDVLVVVGAAALPQLVGHTLMTWSLRHTTPTAVALATLGEPAGASLLGVVVLHEPLTLVVVLACLCTLAGVALGLTGARRA